ncbi:uncharacterized protein LOC141633620 [Silene latifolia]|uniref:uncharacterized protein LOC141633620 n=1 Tax=Silene latifolia TaxID=37657 RepID=UPI003D7725D7
MVNRLLVFNWRRKERNLSAENEMRGPAIVKAVVLNMGMLASYDQYVESFRDSAGLGEASTPVEAAWRKREKRKRNVFRDLLLQQSLCMSLS